MCLSYSNYFPVFQTSTAGMKSQSGLKFLYVISLLDITWTSLTDVIGRELKFEPLYKQRICIKNVFSCSETVKYRCSDKATIFSK